MKRAAFVVILTAILLTFTGCPEFFTFNIYDGLDPVFPPDKAQLEEMGTDEALDYLEEEIGSDSFIDALVQDEENTPEGENSSLDDVKEYLEGVYTDPNQKTEDRTTAAVLAADVELEASGASDVVNNLLGSIDKLQGLSSDPAVTEDDVKEIFTAIIPSDIAADEQAFKEMLNGFFAAADVYATLGDNVLTSGGDIGDSVTGGVVWNAAITVVLDDMTEGLVNGGEDRADVLWDLMQGEDVSTRIDTNGFTMVAPQDDPTIANIADAAGLDISAIFQG